MSLCYLVQLLNVEVSVDLIDLVDDDEIFVHLLMNYLNHLYLCC